MTPVVDWRELFTAQEAALYELLLDEESDAWHIHELIDAAGLRDRAVVGEGLRALVAPLRTCLGFIDEVLRRHPQILPALCLREGHYPWIRQRRDVHQFDVGSHLTCCCALAVRGVGGATAIEGGAPLLAAALDADLARTAGDVLPAAAVFHDLFKCFRPRRPLPAKLGPKQPIEWAPAHWSQERRQHRADDDEVAVAVALLPELVGKSAALDAVLRCLQRAEEVSELVAQMRRQPLAAAEGLARIFWSDHPPAEYLTGLNLFLADVAAKGFIKAVPIERKGVTWSLVQATAVLVRSVDPVLAE